MFPTQTWLRDVSGKQTPATTPIFPSDCRRDDGWLIRLLIAGASGGGVTLR
jgi:hypothetical protein